MSKFLDFTNSLGINNAGPGGLLSVVNGLNSIPIINESITIVDLGCNTGFTSMAIGRRFPSSKVIGIDISEKYIKDANAELQNQKDTSNVTFNIGDASNLDLKNESADVVLSSGLMGFVDKPEDVINEIDRILKPNGYALFIDYFYGELKPSQELLSKLNSNIGIGFEKFDLNYWMKLLKNQYLDLVGIECSSLNYRKLLKAETFVQSYVEKQKRKGRVTTQSEADQFKIHVELIIQNFEFLNQGCFLVRKNITSSFTGEHPSHN